MKFNKTFALKSLAIASALVAAGAANAAAVTANVGQTISVADPAGSGRQATLTLVSGSGALTYSNGNWALGNDFHAIAGLMDALNVARVQITGTGGVTVQTLNYTDPDFGDVYRYSSTAFAPVVAVTADNVTGQVLAVQSIGGVVHTGTRINGTLTGGTASVTNLKFDLANKVVVADLVGRKSAIGTSAAVNYNLPGTALWNIATITGPTAISPAAVLAADPVAAMAAAGFSNIVKKTDAQGAYYEADAVNTISGLSITQAGFDFFRNGLGLGNVGIAALRNVTDYGSISSTLTFSVRDVPEPSTYLMVVLGLGVMGVMARRRA